MTQRRSTSLGPGRILGIIGHPVAHSASPAMHNAAFAAQGMHAMYGAFDVPPSQLEKAIAGIRTLGLLGVNVTIPHKEAVMAYLDDVAPTARQVGAVNTIINRGGRLIGYNTDGWGFLLSLEERGIRLAGRSAVVLGAGGAARAVALHLGMAGVARLTIINRSRSRAEFLAADLARARTPVRADVAEPGSGEALAALAEAGLVVNCTPLGMDPDRESTPLEDVSILPGGCVVYDTIYRPLETRLLREARRRGLMTINGLAMLVHQGACAWEYWFGRRGPVDVMRTAAMAALEEQS